MYFENDAIQPIGRNTPRDRTAQANILNWNWFDYPGMGPQVYTVKTGDTLETIAMTYHGTLESMEVIAKENGLLMSRHALRAGQVIQIPAFIPAHNNVTTKTRYQQFHDVIVGSLSPHINIPQPPISIHRIHHNHFFGTLAKVLAVTLVIVAAAHFAPLLIGSDLSPLN